MSRRTILFFTLAALTSLAGAEGEPGWKADLHTSEHGDMAAARLALERLGTSEDPAALPALLALAPSLDGTRGLLAVRSLKSLARRQSKDFLLDGIVEAGPECIEVSAVLLGDAFSRNRAMGIATRLVTDQAGILAPALAATGRIEAADLLLDAIGNAEGLPRRHLILALGRLSGFTDRVMPTLVRLRKEAAEDDLAVVFAAALRLPGQRTAAWLASESMGEDLETLAELFDPALRPDVLEVLVRMLPGSLPALRRLTGQELPASGELWLEWIKELRAGKHESAAAKPGETDEDDENPEDEPEELRDRPRFYGVPIPVGDFAFLLDASTSMREEKDGVSRIENVKAKVTEVLDVLMEDQRFNIVFFNTGARGFRGAPVYATPENVRLAKRFVRKIEASGKTNLEAGLRKAIRDPGVTEVILLSDGHPTVGRMRSVEDVLRLLSGRRVKIHTISHADMAVSPLMRDLAKKTGGRCTTF